MPKLFFVEPTTNPAGVYVRIVEGNFSENSSYTINDATNTTITISDIQSNNFIVGIPDASQSNFFTGAYVTAGTTSDSSYDSSGNNYIH